MERAKANILQYLRQLQYDSLLERPLLLHRLMFKHDFCSRMRAGRRLFAGCGSKDDSEPAVATPALSLSRERVPIGSPLRLTYRFDVAPNAKIDGDYWVFVHVLEPDGERLWVDDHLPPTPTSTWKAGAESRVHADRLRPELSVHRAGGRADRSLRSENQQAIDARGRAGIPQGVPVAKFELQPQSENIFLIFKEGWHPAEVSSGDPNTEWQWTKKSATISFRNPKKDATVYLEYAAQDRQVHVPPAGHRPHRRSGRSERSPRRPRTRRS